MECDICLSEFDALEHLPKVLSCGHSLCSSCLKSRLTKCESLRRVTFECVQCRAPIATNEIFPTQFLVLRMLTVNQNANKEAKVKSAVGSVAQLPTPPPPYSSFPASLPAPPSASVLKASSTDNVAKEQVAHAQFMQQLSSMQAKLDKIADSVSKPFSSSSSALSSILSSTSSTSPSSTSSIPITSPNKRARVQSSSDTSAAMASDGLAQLPPPPLVAFTGNLPSMDGAYVDCRDAHGFWCPAQIMEHRIKNSNSARVAATLEFKIHFLAWDSKWDEWIPANNRQRLAPFQYFSCPIEGQTAPFKCGDEVVIYYRLLRDDSDSGRWTVGVVKKVEGWQLYCQFRLQLAATCIKRWFYFKHGEIMHLRDAAASIIRQKTAELERAEKEKKAVEQSVSPFNASDSNNSSISSAAVRELSSSSSSSSLLSPVLSNAACVAEAPTSTVNTLPSGEHKSANANAASPAILQSNEVGFSQSISVSSALTGSSASSLSSSAAAVAASASSMQTEEFIPATATAPATRRTPSRRAKRSLPM